MTLNDNKSLEGETVPHATPHAHANEQRKPWIVLHVLGGKVAGSKVEEGGIKREKTREKHRLCHRLAVLVVVAVHEAAALCHVAVEVNVKLDRGPQRHNLASAVEWEAER